MAETNNFTDVEGVVFDFNGVLANTNDTHTAARMAAFNAHAARKHDSALKHIPTSLHEVAYRHGAGAHEIIHWVLDRAGIEPGSEMVEQLAGLKADFYKEMVQEGADVYEGAIDFVHWATDTYGSKNLAIASRAKKAVEIEPFLERHRLLGAFSVIVCKENTPPGRSKPDIYAHKSAAEGLSIAPERLLVIEDSPEGIRSAKAIGAISVGLMHTHSLAELEPDILVQSYDSLRTVLEQK